jgi:hypothetical protein
MCGIFHLQHCVNAEKVSDFGLFQVKGCFTYNDNNK